MIVVMRWCLISAYRQNMIALDPTTLADDVELGLTSQTVIPPAARWCWRIIRPKSALG